MLWAHAHTRNPGSNPAEQIGPRVVPRGVAIPDVPQQLFDAAERLLLRDGPGGLTSRAITDEAGCAKGILHNHFADLDGFLAAFVVDRSRRIAEHAKQLASTPWSPCSGRARWRSPG
jgi:AcrR family transcriptional regulator